MSTAIERMKARDAQRVRRAATRDEEAPLTGLAKFARTDLGLAVLSAVAVPGVCYDLQEIAAFCGCSDAAICLIQQRALRKLRNRLVFLRDPVLAELLEGLLATKSQSRAESLQPRCRS